MRTRLTLGAVGLVVGGFGVHRALQLEPSSWVPMLSWLAGGVVLHDLVLSPLVLLLGWAGARWLPRPWRAPVVVAGVVWGSLTLLAVPVLGRFGAKPTDPWLLDRPYQLSWWIGTAVVVLLVVVAGAVRARAPSALSGPTQ